jgi:N-acetylglucosaminyldiphosphoundecaprenol N-acetyl-beta-D-mannosaminyltransferase
MNVERTEVLGVPVDAVNMQSALDRVRMMFADTATHTIFAVNPEKVIAAQENPELLRALNNASLLVPDGIGVVFAARLLGKGRMERVPGSDLMPEICALAATEGYSVFLFGAKPGIADEAAAILQARYPGLRVAGTHHGYVPEGQTADLIRKINDSRADALFVGLGSPKQEFWLDQYRDHLDVRVCQGVGGTLDAICGNPKRAPRWVQRLYLEWLHRLLLQPRRARRQSVLPRFVRQVLERTLARKRAG